VVGYKIQDKAQTSFMGALNQVPQIFLTPKPGIDLVKVDCIVGVVGIGQKDMAEPNGRDTEIGNIVECGDDALKVPPHELNEFVRCQPATRCRGKAIDKDLIDNGLM